MTKSLQALLLVALGASVDRLLLSPTTAAGQGGLAAQVPGSGDTNGGGSGRYWSSTTSVAKAGNAWVLNGLFGNVADNAISKEMRLAFVLAVRG